MQEVYNPKIWGRESFYDELAKAQKVEMEKREKERKERTKVINFLITRKNLPHYLFIYLEACCGFVSGGICNRNKENWGIIW